MKRYHPLLVVLHWLLAFLILVALLFGGRMLAQIDNSAPEKLFSLTGHMIWGLSIGALLVVRLITRLVARKPPVAETGNELANKAGQAAHWTLYVLAFAMVGSGIGIALSTDLFAIVFGGSGSPLPANFNDFPARAAHGLISWLLLAVISLHLVGWAFHQFIRRDGLISRMWFGKRTPD